MGMDVSHINPACNRNRQVDEKRLAVVVAAILDKGPSKTRRIPLVAGVTNAGKSLVLSVGCVLNGVFSGVVHGRISLKSKISTQQLP